MNTFSSYEHEELNLAREPAGSKILSSPKPKHRPKGERKEKWSVSSWYKEASENLLYLWMLKILSDAEYDSIMDRLNNWYTKELNKKS